MVRCISLCLVPGNLATAAIEQTVLVSRYRIARLMNHYSPGTSHGCRCRSVRSSSSRRRRRQSSSKTLSGESERTSERLFWTQSARVSATDFFVPVPRMRTTCTLSLFRAIAESRLPSVESLRWFVSSAWRSHLHNLVAPGSGGSREFSATSDISALVGSGVSDRHQNSAFIRSP